MRMVMSVRCLDGHGPKKMVSAGAKNVAALLKAAAATKRRREECRDLNIPLTSILMRRGRWREECQDFDISHPSAASSEHANQDRRWRCGNEKHHAF